jgi:hypothetical protein
MPATDALIHEFDPKQPPQYDDEGDQMLGFYFQFIDTNEQPVSGLVGPYKYRVACENAARRAFQARDF